MTMPWTQEFDERLRAFAERQGAMGLGISVKLPAAGGCFHRDHSPRAYELIERRLDSIWHPEFPCEYVEHETGPEFLVWVGAGTAVALLVKSIVDLVVAILKARSEGIKKGDCPREPVELIVRRSVDRDCVKDELTLRFGHEDKIDQAEIERCVAEVVRRLRKPDGPPHAAG